MNLATPLALYLDPLDPVEQNPTAALFGSIERQFGNTCTQLAAKRNTIICSQGTKLSCLYLIKQGEILLTRLSSDGRETLISILGPGEFFGESSLLGGTEVTFSARVTKRSALLLLPERKFRRLLEDPWVCRTLLQTIAQRCDDAWTQMEMLGCTHARDKVRSGLIWLSGKIGVETRGGVRIDLNQTQLARMVGCARETLSREVSELRRQRAIEVRQSKGRKSFYVVRPDELSQPAL
ncbi:MAG: Crp/Fnr family transcriptional regulator [Acidobacteria bacterium]|nr:Crp/Fnr family transcriptional regulator [Acidobacteriota bacterium]